MWDSAVTEVIGEKKVEALRVKDLKTGEERVIPFDGLFVAIGYDPNTKIFADQLEMDQNGYLIVKERDRDRASRESSSQATSGTSATGRP